MEPNRAACDVLVVTTDASFARDLALMLGPEPGGVQVRQLAPEGVGVEALAHAGYVCVDGRSRAPWLGEVVRGLRAASTTLPIVLLHQDDALELEALAWGADECAPPDGPSLTRAVRKAQRRRLEASRAAQVFQRENELARQRRSRRHNEVLRALAKQLAADDLCTGLRAITEAAVESMEVTQAGIWLFDEQQAELRLEDLFDSRTSAHDAGAVLSAPENPEYFRALQDERVISAPDVTRHPALQRFFSAYLGPRGVTSVLDAPVRVGERVLGVICHEQIGSPRNWTDEDQALAGSLADFVALAIESHEHRKAEAALARSRAQLEDARRIEAVGRLAGGVAHDFNNVITVVSSYAFLLARKLDKDDALQGPVAEIGKAAERAADITRKLLALNRRDPVAPRVLDMNGVIRGMETFLRRLIGEHIQLEVKLSKDPLLVLADPGLVEQVVLNLVVNARDAAAPEGGRVEIRTHYDPKHGATHPCLLEILDTGTGMPPEVRSRIFEPFFTTKEVGKGSGLGLFTVWGAVTQMGGTIEVMSELNRGSHFILRFAEAAPDKGPLVGGPERSELIGSETILLVEDEAQVREVTALILKDLGYRVLVAENIDQAVAHAKSGVHVDLLVSDIVMPRASGPVVAARLKELIPSLTVLFISGYSKDMLSAYDASLGPTLPKPFTVEQIGKKVRELLNQKAAPRPTAARP